MKYLIIDKSGKADGAKTAFMLALSVCLIKIIFSGVTIGNVTLEVVDYSGMSMFLSPLAAVYWGRSHTKEKAINDV
tara:strand:+ start:168 stop:395 length:228 start_codon:yes stop_codon:yes gene_type:complete